MRRIRRILAAFATVAAALLVLPALALAHHLTNATLSCTTLAFQYDADTGATFTFVWNNDGLTQTKSFVGRGSFSEAVPKRALSTAMPTSVKITSTPAFDAPSGYYLLTTQGSCLKPPPPPPHKKHHHKHHPKPVPTFTG